VNQLTWSQPRLSRRLFAKQAINGGGGVSEVAGVDDDHEAEDAEDGTPCDGHRGAARDGNGGRRRRYGQERDDGQERQQVAIAEREPLRDSKG